MNQKYEKYRKLTVEYTDIQEERFIGTLGLIINFIDRDNDNYSSRKYKKLQNLIDSYFPKRDLASVRKSINQFVKLGFIDFNLTSYHERSKEFIKAVTNEQRSEIFTEIFITNASFNKSVTNDDNFKDVKFIFKTLSEVGELSIDNIAALMSIDNHYKLYPNGYINRDKLDQLTRSEQVQEFKSRKYNQIGYCINFLKQLDNISFVNQNFYFLDKAPDPIISDKRDSTRQAIYKDDLMVESNSKCMVKNLAYPSLRAAHIKPWILCEPNEKYDPNNGLLLSLNLDKLFELVHIHKTCISFEDNGKIIFTKKCPEDIKDYYQNYQINEIYLNNERIKYLQYHRQKLREQSLID